MVVVTCRNCNYSFNTSYKKPYHLDYCEHQICLSCIQDFILNNRNRCKVCNTKFLKYNINALLLEFITETSDDIIINNVENLTKTCINLLKDIADIILSQSIKIFTLDNSSVSIENLLEINDRLMLSVNMLKN